MHYTARRRTGRPCIAAGIDQSALVEAMNEAQEKRVAAQAKLNGGYRNASGEAPPRFTP